MKIMLSELRDFIRSVIKESLDVDTLWQEVDDEFKPNFTKWPKFGYHGTTLESAQKMLRGFKAEGFSIAFEQKLALSYGRFKTDSPVLLQIELRKLKPLQWSGPDIARNGVYMNYDTAGEAFDFNGRVPADALKLVQTREKTDEQHKSLRT